MKDYFQSGYDLGYESGRTGVKPGDGHTIINDPDAPEIIKDFIRREEAAYGSGARPQMNAEELRAFEEYDRKLDARLERHGVEKDQVEVMIAHLSAMDRIVATGGVFLHTNETPDRTPRLKAHEIIEQTSSHYSFLLRGELVGKEYSKDTAFIPLTAEEIFRIRGLVDVAQKFDIRCIHQADIEPNASFADSLEERGLLKLPFNTCWFEFDAEVDITFGVFCQGDFQSEFFVKIAGGSWAKWDNIKFGSDKQKRIGDDLRRIIRAACVIATSRCALRHEIPAPDKLNKARIAKGRVPIYSHTIIEIKAFKAVDPETGETILERRSPRMHWRRGHLRHLRNPDGSDRMVIPIAPMLVGNASLGFSDHDYKLAGN